MELVIFRPLMRSSTRWSQKCFPRLNERFFNLSFHAESHLRHGTWQESKFPNFLHTLVKKTNLILIKVININSWLLGEDQITFHEDRTRRTLNQSLCVGPQAADDETLKKPLCTFSTVIIQGQGREIQFILKGKYIVGL